MVIGRRDDRIGRCSEMAGAGETPMNTPWAILLCKFRDHDDEPYGPGTQRYQDLFTSAGGGRFGMVDFFAEMSHGRVDLSDSRVFGWYKLDKRRSDYTGSGQNPAGRNELVAWARAAAAKAGDDLSPYFGVVVLTNVPTDMFGGRGVVVSHDERNPDNGMSGFSPSMLGQEMGHAYGLNHSRDDASGADYTDRWDIMSTANARMAPHPFFTERDVSGRPIFQVGPGLNAANMRSVGWLDESRVWRAGDDEYGMPVVLRPLHRRDLPGYLALEVGPYLVEFRVPERWDAGIGAATVLVHQFAGGHSYLENGAAGHPNLSQSDTFGAGASGEHLAPWLEIEVIQIDPVTRTATLRVDRRRDRRPVVGPAASIFGTASDAGGIAFVNGRIVIIPPRSPSLHLLEAVASMEEADRLTSANARWALQEQALAVLQRSSSLRMEQLNGFFTPSVRVAEIDPKGLSAV
ncbi:MAG: hypothetical protein KDA21_08630 [Phycisphaerales bacterium]|nr:hypothetical protein [Phycisphaerales bacterium]